MATEAAAHTLGPVLDQTFRAVVAGRVRTGLDGLCHTLADLRRTLPPDEWKAVTATTRAHKVHTLLQESPLTRQAFLKPRGYMPDADLLDLAYGCGAPPEPRTALGSEIYAWEFGTAACRSLRARREVLACEIDSVANAQPHAHVLAIGCGHLREIELSKAALTGKVTVHAFDPDKESLELVAREYGKYGVLTTCGTVADLLYGRVPRHRFALVYAADLLGSLACDVARATASAMFRSVAPRGRLLLANLTPALRQIGYMEACMDWHVAVRDDRHMSYLVGRIPEEDINKVEQFQDSSGDLCYIRVTRR
jgi:hypothetical protein